METKQNQQVPLLKNSESNVPRSHTAPLSQSLPNTESNSTCLVGRSVWMDDDEEEDEGRVAARAQYEVHWPPSVQILSRSLDKSHPIPPNLIGRAVWLEEDADEETITRL